MNIDLGDGLVNVKFKGHVYKLREPSMDDVDKFKDAKEDGRFIEKFLKDLGMPESAIKEMGLLTQRKFLDQLIKPISAKK
jgi:hypothetical protein